MNDYLLQHPEEMKQLLIKYRFLMAEAGFTVDDLLKLNGTGVQELMRFNPINFYHDYISSKDLLPTFAKLILNVQILNSGIISEVAGQIATSSISLDASELKAKMIELDDYYNPKKQEETVSAVAAMFKPIEPAVPTLEQQWGLGQVSEQFRPEVTADGSVMTLIPGSTDGIIPILPSLMPDEKLNRLEEFREDLIELIPSNDSTWVKEIKPSMGALPEDGTFKTR